MFITHAENRQLLDSITSKTVLILGRFTNEREAILDALRGELRKRNYSPILLAPDKPNSRDIGETLGALAHMARFLIADLTDAESLAVQLQAIVPNLASVPVQLMMASTVYKKALFGEMMRFPWVLDTYQYSTIPQLLASLADYVIQPAEAKVVELRKRA